MEVRFYLAYSNKKESHVQAIIRHEGQRYKFSVKEIVIVKYWNATTYRCRVVRDYPSASFINQRLDEWEAVIIEAFNSFGIVTPTRKLLVDKIDDIIRNKNIEAGGFVKNEEDILLVNFAEKFCEESIRAKRTKTSYITCINKLKEFERIFKTRLRFIDIDIDFYNKFKNWMLNSTYTVNTKNVEGELEPTHVNYSKNYIGGLFKHIITFMNAAKKKKLHDCDGYLHEEFKSEQEDIDTIYLTIDEVQRIFDLEFTPEFLIENGFGSRPQNLNLAIKSLSEERDSFLIGCLTALRHSDYSRLEDVHFKNELLAVWTLKRDKKVFIPMHYLLRQILERRNNILPKSISGQKHNDQIKVLGRLAGIDEEVLLTKTRGGKREDITGPKYSFITSHTARRSGATNMYLAGIDAKFIQELLGHSKVEQTLKYIKVSAEDNAKRLQNHEYFTGKKTDDKTKKRPTKK